MATVKARTDRRKATVRRAIKEAATGRVRLTVFRSSKHIYAQVIDDQKGGTVASASSIEKGVKSVVFDRGGYLYHGRIKALADAAREGGLQF